MWMHAAQRRPSWGKVRRFLAATCFSVILSSRLILSMSTCAPAEPFHGEAFPRRGQRTCEILCEKSTLAGVFGENENVITCADRAAQPGGMRRHRDRRFAGTALCSGAFALLLCAIVDGVMRAIVSPFPSPVVLLDDAAEIRAEHVAADSAFKRDGLRKMSALRVEAHKVEGNPDVHILKHEDRTLSAIKRLGSTKGMHLDLAPMSTGSSVSGGGDRGSEGGFLPGRHERAPTTVAAVARIARKAGVKISASITKSEQAKAAAMVAALMSGAKPQVHKHVASKRATFHRKMKQALFDYKLYKGRKGHVATADAKPTSPLPAMLGLRGRTAGRDAGVDAVLNPAAAAAAKKAAFHAKMAAALLAYERYNAPEGSGAGGGEAGTQPVLPLAPGTQEQTSSANWDAQPEEPAQAVMPGTATREHSQPDMVVSGWGPGQALTGQSGRGAGGVDKKALTELVQRFCPGVMSPQLCVEAIANGSLPHPDATAQKPQRPRATPSLVVKIPSSAPHNHAGFVCGQTGCAPRHKGERGRAGGLGAFGSESGSDGGWGQQIMRQEQLTWGGGLGRGRGRYTCDQDGCSMKTGPYSRQAAERPDASGGGLECDETGCRVRARRRRRFRHGVLALGLRQVQDCVSMVCLRGWWRGLCLCVCVLARSRDRVCACVRVYAHAEKRG